ncbi:meiotic cell cortex C-terminal pleckstrin homology-domain-containing protein [Mortierella sp. GBAus27b]|nr:meiotic cell cortex C-terminal pleckstrin homology-domain-containing protein [Mortierella sp. GBAus27b]
MKEKVNQEYDARIQEQERIIDALNKQRRLREENDEKRQEDMWNLELQNQEFKNQNNELQSQLSKAQHENTKLQKTATSATELAEQLRSEAEKTAARAEQAKIKADQEMSSLRGHSAGLQREKTELLTRIDELNAENAAHQQKLQKAAQDLAQAQAQALEEREREKENSANAPPILIVPPTKAAVTEDSATTATALAAAATAAAVAAPEGKTASLARETSFAHQQSIINDLKSKLENEITERKELQTENAKLQTEKEELKEILADHEETIQTLRLEGPSAFEPEMLNRSARNSRHPSEMGGDAEDQDHLGMTMSDERAAIESSSSGGLFAELAQANSGSSGSSKPTVDSKPAAEYKDQEIMTEPIESWIRETPEVEELVKDVTAKAVESAHKEAEVATQEAVAKAVETANKEAETATQEAVAKAVETANKEAEVATQEAVAKAVETAHKEAETSTKEAVAKAVETAHKEAETSTKEAVAAAVAAAVASAAVATAVAKHSDDSETKHIDVGTSEAEAEAGAKAEVDDETSEDKPRRRSRSTVPIDEERRHTCDLSQVIAESSQSVPPMPKEHSADHLSPEDDEDHDPRVSFGSAFGGDPSAKDTGRISPVFANKDAEHKDTPSSNEDSSAAPVNVERDQPVLLPSQPTATDPKTGRPLNTEVSVTSHTTYTFEQNSQVQLPNLNNNNTHHYHTITDASGATVGRQPNYRPSPEGSVSSLSTDYNHASHYRNGRRMSNGSNYETTPTDLTMIQSITQTMIGDYLMKYTRRRITNRMSEKCHKRYVWVHPYNKTIHWSLNNPGVEGEQRAKSANILDVTQETDENHNPNSELPNISLVIHTTTRNLKMKAPTREKHDLWFQAIKYLMTRPSTPGADLASDNQTWSELQEGGNHHDNHFSRHHQHHGRSLSASSAHLSGEALSMRPIDKTSLRKKTSMARLMGRPPGPSGSASSISSPIVPPKNGTTGSPSALQGITTTAAAVGHENGSAKSTPTHSSTPGLA